MLDHNLSPIVKVFLGSGCYCDSVAVNVLGQLQFLRREREAKRVQHMVQDQKEVDQRQF